MILLLLSLLFMAGNTPSAGRERLTLLDGTVFVGNVLSISNDTLYFMTSFHYELHIVREKIASIEYEAQGDTKISAEESNPAGTGKLLIIITGPPLTSTIRFRRAEDRERALEANRLFFRITANGRVVYEKVDDVIDEEIRSEGWIILKNNFQSGRYEVSLPAGEYRVNVFLGSDLTDEFRRHFSSGMVKISKTREGVRLLQGEVTTLFLKSSQAFLNMGGYDLNWGE